MGIDLEKPAPKVTPDQLEAQALRKSVDQLFDEFLDLSDEEILDKTPDIVIRGVAKKLHFPVTELHPKTIGIKFIQDMRKRIIEIDTANEQSDASSEKNKFWLLRSSHGRDKIFASPDQLESACLEYLQACSDRPLKKQIAFSNGKKATVSLMRAPTLKGLFIFLNVNRQTWENYKSKEGFLAIIEQIEDIIYTEKLTGAMAGLLKENLVARELGLADKQDFGLNNATDEQLDNLLKNAIEHGKRAN